MSIWGKSAIWQGTSRNRFGPMHWNGEHLSAKTGSINKFMLSPILITAVECPIHVYFILSFAHLKLGFLLIGNFLSSYYMSTGIDKFVVSDLHLRNNLSV